MTKQMAELEVKRSRLHDYITMKLEERDYHAIADAAMDLREIDAKLSVITTISVSEMATKVTTSIPSTANR